MNSEIIVVGSLNQDIVVQVQRFPNAGETVIGSTVQTFSGGKGANQAFAAGKLGARVAMLGQVGCDDAGEAQIANLVSVGVQTGGVCRTKTEPTGTAVIAVETNGENRIVAVPGANGTFTADKLDPSAFYGSRIVLLQLEVPFETVGKAIEHSHSAGATVVLDPAPAPDRGLPDEWLGKVDYLTPNSSELSKLTGRALSDTSESTAVIEAARLLCARGVKTILAKLGARGAIIVTVDSAEHVPGFSVKPIDTTAAGDCFNAAFAVALTHRKNMRDAIRWANAAAACSVTRAGAQASMPTRDEVERMIRSQTSQ